MHQEKTEELQQKNEGLERNVSEVVTENRHLKEPLAMANNEVAEMRAKTDDYDNMKSILQVGSQRVFMDVLAIERIPLSFTAFKFVFPVSLLYSASFYPNTFSDICQSTCLS